ncbi:740_t:CDS:1, partial [Cetraspora pellucida]
GLGVVTTDLLQKNDLSEVKQHEANCEYRNCKTKTQELSNNNYVIIKHAHYYYITNMQFSKIES